MRHPMLAAVAAFAFLSAGAIVPVDAIFLVDAMATPLQDCAATAAATTCLDAKLKAANQKLNATLKAAQEKLEQLQSHGRRPVLGAFIDSQRKFNAYRDAQCNWQGIRATSPTGGADYVKDCQIRATLAREQELAEFLAGEETVAAAPPPPVEEIKVTRTPDALPAGEPAPSAAGGDGAPPVAVRQVVPEPAVVAKATEPQAEVPPAAQRGSEWRLVKWIANGAEKAIAPDSNVTIAFDPSGKIAGSASVNRYSGSYRFDVDGRLRWPPGGFALTRMAGPPALMTQERAFLDSLKRTSLYKIEGSQLVLESANESVVLTFTR